MGPYKPITNGKGVVYLMDFKTERVIATYPLTAQGGGIYTAAIPTSGLAVGTYLLVGVVDWTGTTYYYYAGSGPTMHNEYGYHVYGVLNVLPAAPRTTTTTTTSGPAPTTTTSPAPTTTAPSGFSPAIGIVIALIVIAVISIIVGVARGGRRTT